MYDKVSNKYNEIERLLPGVRFSSVTKTATETIENGKRPFIQANDLFQYDPHKYKRHAFDFFCCCSEPVQQKPYLSVLNTVFFSLHFYFALKIY